MSTTVLTPLSLGPGALPAIDPAPRTAFRHRIARAFAVTTVSVACTVVLLLFAFNGYIAWMLTHPPIAALNTNPLAAKNLAYADVTFPSADGARETNGWWIPAGDSVRTVVLSHGFGANREEYWVPMYDLADLLHGLHYNVLMFDYGYADAKHRTPATGGREESQQLIGALQYARERGTEELVVWGFSMGAGTALQAALHTGLIDGMILDSTFVPSTDTLAHNLKPFTVLPHIVSVDLIRLFLPLWSGTYLDQIPSGEVESKAYDFPILLIHGTADAKAPYGISERIAASQHNPESQLWIVPNAIHEMIFRTHPEEYVARTTAFLSGIDALAASRLAGTRGLLSA
ncbi:alpha/beta hydrolase [Cohnella nanjingensis]|uniref:Alpha/beta fold hydrolase n=1 Tax=Cohnella nanjingensis TaxID=1387779 RepID=A0A7X0VHB1_9BACL|nr:alpha/beta fold hydrolase [Cohnella nanjingensis]MBB6673298.1 alpha/beta fold hydrolase [Cohnella nanjingensis]